VIGRDTTGQGEPPHANLVAVNGDYFRTMGIPLLRGRTFGAQDAEPPRGPGAAMSFVIDAALARRYFPGEDPIGRRLNQGPDGVIVGVVGEVRDASLRDSTKATIYYNYSQGWLSTYTVVVRSALPDDAAARAIRAAVRSIDPQLPVFDAASMPEVVRRSVGARRFGAAVLAGFAALALLLAGLGVYGVLTYVVAQRTRELGIRAALGASARQVRALVLGEGVRLAGVGLAVGALAFLAGGRVVASQLYGVGPRDPATILAGAALLGAVALVASYVPARRAMRVDPGDALRAD
jgi:predicted permease